MNPSLPVEAEAFGAAAARAFASLGGVDAARTAEADPSTRRTTVGRALAALGVDGLDPREDLDTAAAAGELCRQAGRVALPYPVVGALLSVDGIPFALGPAPIDHGDLFDGWRSGTIDGRVSLVAPAGSGLGSRLGPFVTPMSEASAAGSAPWDSVLHLTLTGWQILGTLERAVELAVEHVTGRIQFGKPLSSFQAVQFQLADAAVAVEGVRELCRYTLWRAFDADPPDALSDALALRLAALDSARLVLRTTQQLHGAAGVCDEYDISILCRHVQPALRLPFGAERTATELASAIEAHGFESLFPHGGHR